MEEIYKKCKDSTRQRILIDSIIERSKFSLDDILEANASYKAFFKIRLDQIEELPLLKLSINSALNMFEGNSMFKVMLNREGAYEPLLQAKKELFEAKTPDPQKAYLILKNAKVGKGVYILR